MVNPIQSSCNTLFILKHCSPWFFMFTIASFDTITFGRGTYELLGLDSFWASTIISSSLAYNRLNLVPGRRLYNANNNVAFSSATGTRDQLPWCIVRRLSCQLFANKYVALNHKYCTNFLKKKLQASPNWNKKHYKSVEFWLIFWVSTPPAQTQNLPADMQSPPIENFLATVLPLRMYQPPMHKCMHCIFICHLWLPISLNHSFQHFFYMLTLNLLVVFRHITHCFAFCYEQIACNLVKSIAVREPT